MENYLPWITAACSLGAAVACVVFIFVQKRGRIATEDLLMELLQQELFDQSEEELRRSSEMRRELNETQCANSMNLTESVRVIGDLQADRIERLERRSGTSTPPWTNASNRCGPTCSGCVRKIRRSWRRSVPVWKNACRRLSTNVWAAPSRSCSGNSKPCRRGWARCAACF